MATRPMLPRRTGGRERLALNYFLTEAAEDLETAPVGVSRSGTRVDIVAHSKAQSWRAPAKSGVRNLWIPGERRVEKCPGFSGNDFG